MDIKRPDLKARKRRKNLIIAAGGAVVVGLLAMLALGVGPAVPKADRDSIWTDQVKRGEMVREVRGAGTLVPKSTRWIANETEARVERLLMKAGTNVRADTIILELSNPVLQEQLATAESELRVAEANVASKRADLEGRLLDLRSNLADVEANYDAARMQMEAESGLVEQRIISRVAYDRNVRTVASLKQKLSIEHERIEKERRNIGVQLAGELARIEQLRNTRELRMHQADSLKVRAGIDGVLQQLLVQEGQQLAAGVNLARVAKPDVLIAQLRIPEAEARDIAVGQKVKLKINNDIVPGQVARIDPGVSNNTVQIDVEPLRPLPTGVRPDLSVDGTVEIEKLRNVLYVGRPADSQPTGTASVFRLDPESDTAQRVQVRFGRASVNQIVIESGLKEGDSIILSDTSAWENANVIGLK